MLLQARGVFGLGAAGSYLFLGNDLAVWTRSGSPSSSPRSCRAATLHTHHATGGRKGTPQKEEGGFGRGPYVIWAVLIFDGE